MSKTNPKHFKAPYINVTDIRAKADAFRRKYWPPDKIPIEILEIIEFDLNLEILAIPNLKEDLRV